MSREEAVYIAVETMIVDLATQLDLADRDRICYLFDYGSEWRFYAILTAIMKDDPSDTASTVTNQKGNPVVQYPPPDEDPRYQ